MSYLSAPRQANKPREERRKVNDPCLWCRSNVRIINRGTIKNESASGALLSSATLPNVGETVLMLPVLWEDTSKSLSYKQIREHPLTRTCTVMRRESNNSVGLRFIDQNDDRPQFRRWFRGEAEISTLFHDDHGMVRINGSIGIEAAALFQSIMKQELQIEYLLVVIYEINQIAPTALTIIRTALRECTNNGVHVYCVYSGIVRRGSQAFLDTPERCVMHNEGYDPGRVPHETEVTDTAETTPNALPPDEDPSMVIVCESSERSIRLETTLKARQQEEAPYTLDRMASFTGAVKQFLEEPPSCILAEIDIDNCSDILELNQLAEAGPTVPRLIVIAPEPLERLLYAALKIPVSAFISPPYSNHDLIDTVHQILDLTA